MGKTRLFVDMDGTLAEFKPVDQLETLYEKGYFENLKPLDNVVGATKEIIRNHPEIEVHILSAHLSDSPYALAEKNAWLNRYLPEIPPERRLFPPCGTDKAEAIPGGLRPTDFLLDDYTHNLTLWEPPARGVKLLNGINHTRGSWKRDCLRYDTPPQELAGNIAKIMRDGIQIRDEKPARPIAAELVSAPVNTPVEGAHTVRTNGETTAPVTTTDEFAVHSVRTAKETQVTAPPAGGTVTPPVHPKALTNEEFEQLWEEIQNITLHYQEDPAMVAEFLAFKAQFYQYSARNALLIQRQNPYSTFVANFKQWEKLGYKINKGEKHMKILRPVEATIFKRTGADGNPEWVTLRDATNEEKALIAAKQIEVESIVRYVPHQVFDISQTNCPREDYPRIYSMGYESVGHAALYENIKEYAQNAGFDVQEKKLDSISLHGYCRPDTGEIAINAALNDSKKLSTLCHELAHGVVHKTSTLPKDQKEFEAECFGVMLQRKYGFPVDETSKSYITKYHGRLEKKKDFDMEKSLSRLSGAFSYVTSGIDKTLTANGHQFGMSLSPAQKQEAAPEKSRGAGIAQAVASNFTQGL